MIQIIASEVGSTWTDFQQYTAKVKEACRTQPANSLVPDEDQTKIQALMEGMLKFCRAFGFMEAAQIAIKIKDQTDWGMRQSPCTNEVMADFMGDLHEALLRATYKKTFAFIPATKERFADKDHLFGPLVSEAFPDANAEIKDAGNSLAFGLNNAAVFHLMRITEFGLRKMAARLKVTLKKNRIEYAGWSTLTKKIRKRIEALEKRTNNEKKLEELEFYHDALDEIKLFRDYWRNEVMHTRGKYNDVQAEDISNRVEKFMRELAAKLLKKRP